MSGGYGVGNSNWQYLAPVGLPQNGSPAVGGGGGGLDLLSGYRSILDAARSAVDPARTPQAEYPDGYLGNVNSRRGDRLLQNVQTRLTQRSYQRGVHKGERLDPQDYFWNNVVDPQAGIIAEAKGEKWTARGGLPAEQINHMGKNHLLAPQDFDKIASFVGYDKPKEIDPVRRERMMRLLPQWR